MGDPALRSRYKQRYVAACCLAFEAVRERKLAAAAEELEARLAELAGRLHAVRALARRPQPLNFFPPTRRQCPCPYVTRLLVSN